MNCKLTYQTRSSGGYQERVYPSKIRSHILPGLAFSSFLLLAGSCLADWNFTGSMNSGRSNHTATLLQDGRVLGVGGIIGSQQPAEVYNPTIGQWSNTGSLGFDLAYHTATLLRDGKVLIAGGTSGALGGDSTEATLYDPATATFTATGSMSTSRSEHTATLLVSGDVLVAGGF